VHNNPEHTHVHTHTYAYTNIYILEDTYVDISAVQAHTLNARVHYEVQFVVSSIIIHGDEHRHGKTAPPSTSSLLGSGELYFYIKHRIKSTEISAGEFDHSHL
jgi:hypothetical protein